MLSGSNASTYLTCRGKTLVVEKTSLQRITEDDLPQQYADSNSNDTDKDNVHDTHSEVELVDVEEATILHHETYQIHVRLHHV